jgi:hypothetical protein
MKCGFDLHKNVIGRPDVTGWTTPDVRNHKVKQYNGKQSEINNFNIPERQDTLEVSFDFGNCLHVSIRSAFSNIMPVLESSKLE